jgi:hypothetical protein
VRADPSCAACGGPSGAEPFGCAECGRALGECADCGWCVRLFEAEDCADCDGCGWRPKEPGEDARLLAEYGPCPECGGPRTAADRRCIRRSWRRMAEAQDQLSAKARPVYEKWRERSQSGSAAWQAAARPMKVAMVGTPDGPRWYLHAPLKRFEYVEATPEQVAAWLAYKQSRFTQGSSRPE